MHQYHLQKTRNLATFCNKLFQIYKMAGSSKLLKVDQSVKRRCPYCARHLNVKLLAKNFPTHLKSYHPKQVQVTVCSPYVLDPHPTDPILQAKLEELGVPTLGKISLRPGYLFHFNETYNVSSWVMEVIRPMNTPKYEERKNLIWILDKNIPLLHIFSPRNLILPASHWERGHLASYMLHQHDPLEKACNMMHTNFCIQHVSLNCGALQQLEHGIADMASTCLCVVFSGTICDDECERVGDDIQTTIPKKIFKILCIEVYPGHYVCEAYLFTNDVMCEDDPTKSRVPIDVINQETGMNFLNKLGVRLHVLHGDQVVTDVIREIIEKEKSTR